MLKGKILKADVDGLRSIVTLVYVESACRL